MRGEEKSKSTNGEGWNHAIDVCSRGARRRRTEDRRVRSGERDVSSEAMAAAVKRCDEEEIEEDFMAVVGHRQPRRPKKRPRTVQKKLHVKSWAFANFDESVWFCFLIDLIWLKFCFFVCLLVFRWLQSLHPAFSHLHRAHVQGA